MTIIIIKKVTICAKTDVTALDRGKDTSSRLSDTRITTEQQNSMVKIFAKPRSWKNKTPEGGDQLQLLTHWIERNKGDMLFNTNKGNHQKHTQMNTDCAWLAEWHICIALSCCEHRRARACNSSAWIRNFSELAC